MDFNGYHPLLEITSKDYWRLNYVTPLYNMHYQHNILRQYASVIRDEIAYYIPSYTIFDVTIEVLPHLKYFQQDANALRFKVLEGVGYKKEEVYSAILMSWGFSTIFANGVHLPYLLERGENRIGAILKQTLQSLFQCSIEAYNFNKFQLLDFYFTFLDNDYSDRTYPIVLSYVLGDYCFINLIFIIGEMIILRNNTRCVYNLDEVKSKLTTYRIMISPVYHRYLIDVNSFDLWRIAFPCGAIRKNGVFNIHKPNVVQAMFLMLNELTFKN